MEYTRADLERQVEAFRLKALQEHDLFRKWQNRALIAEQRLADCTCTERQAPQQPALWEEQMSLDPRQQERAWLAPDRPSKALNTNHGHTGQGGYNARQKGAQGR